MKSLKQSRIDRLLRNRLRTEKAELAEKKITPHQRILQNNKLLKEIGARYIAEGMKKCRHGIEFSGYSCMACNSDVIATRLRDEWSPVQEYKVTVIDDVADGAIPLTIRTRNLTKKIKEMQENGFWYPWNGCPVFMTPNRLRVIVVDGMAQSHGHSVPTETPEPKDHGIRRSARQ